MILLSDLWRTEEDRMTSTNTNTSTDRKRAFVDASNSSSESLGIENYGRPSGLRRVRCRARLLALADHDADNAYFEIPLDAPHGMVMSCSHPKCAASGRRFRYCRGKVLCSFVRIATILVARSTADIQRNMPYLHACFHGVWFHTY